MINNRIVKSTSMAAVASMLVGTAFAAGVVPAYAGEVANNDITITAAAHGQSTKPDMATRTFKAYKIASYTDVQFDGTGTNRHAIGYDLTGVVPEDEMKDAIKAAVGAQWNGVVAADGDSIKFVGDAANLNAYQFVAKYFYGTGSDVYGNAHADKAEMRKFANALMNSHSFDTATPITAPVTVAGDTATVAVPDNGGEGIYLIVETSDHTDGNTVSRAMVTGSPFKDGNKFIDTLVNGNTTYTLGKLTLKADTVTVDKETYKTGDAENIKDQLVGEGSERGFQITTNVPEYMNDYQDWMKSGKVPVFTIGDNPSYNLTPHFETIEVYKGSINAANELTWNTDYTVSFGDDLDDPNNFAVNLTFTKTDGSLDADKLKALSGQKIIVRYNATVNRLDHTDEYEPTDNTATVDFSNDPYEDKHGTVTDNERLYEADLNLKKVAWNNAGSRLEGAEFQVWKGDAAGDANTVLKFRNAGDRYILDKHGTDNKVVLEFGETTLKGLAADSDTAVTYHFKETKAPAGYILGENPVEFNVTLTPTFGSDGELQKVTYSINSANHGNFTDLTRFAANGVNAPANDGTVIVDAPAIVENTTNIKDFAKTGGEIVAYIAIALGLAVAGSLTAAAARRNRARKTA